MLGNIVQRIHHARVIIVNAAVGNTGIKQLLAGCGIGPANTQRTR